MAEDIHSRLKHLIEDILNETMGGFAKGLSVSPTVIYNIVGGRKSKPSFQLLEKLAIERNISSDWIITGKGNPFMSNDIKEPIKFGTLNSETSEKNETENANLNADLNANLNTSSPSNQQRIIWEMEKEAEIYNEVSIAIAEMFKQKGVKLPETIDYSPTVQAHRLVTNRAAQNIMDELLAQNEHLRQVNAHLQKANDHLQDSNRLLMSKVFEPSTSEEAQKESGEPQPAA
jgi:hypothetical protein